MKKIYFVCMAAVLFLASCAKEDEKGCMDPDASNYNADAIEDCCCEYKGRVVFFFGQEASNRLKAQDSKSLIVYVGETTPTEKIGTFPTSKYWNGIPPCGSEGSITIERNLGTSTKKTYKYLVVDELGRDIWKGSQEWKATTGSICTPVEWK